MGREGEAVLLLLAGPELGVLGELREFSLDLSSGALRTLRLGPLIWKPIILGETGKKLSVITKGGRTAGPDLSKHFSIKVVGGCCYLRTWVWSGRLVLTVAALLLERFSLLRGRKSGLCLEMISSDTFRLNRARQM